MNNTNISECQISHDYHVKIQLNLQEPNHVSEMDKTIGEIIDQNHLLVSVRMNSNSILWHLLSKNFEDEGILLIIEKVKKTTARLLITPCDSYIIQNKTSHIPLKACIKYQNSPVIVEKEIQCPVFVIFRTEKVQNDFSDFYNKFLCHIKTIDANFETNSIDKITYTDKFNKVVLQSNIPDLDK